MTKEKSRKQLLSTNDEFVTFSARMLILAGEHKKQLQIAGYCILVIIILFTAGNIYLKNRNSKAQDAYNTAYYAISGNISPEKKQEIYSKAREDFGKVLSGYKMSKAASLTIPQMAHIDFLEKKYDDAIKKYQDYLDKRPAEPYYSYALIALSTCYEEKGDYDTAVNILEKAVAKSEGYSKEQAMLSLAGIYRVKKNFAKSNEILKDFIEKFPSSSFIEVAKASISS
ncbi:MAG: tetratricopeptide repeat protein [Desulfatiglans sp.]|jgi:tetratricopeptide (TPR) repeat protein|nr:tetratricopeptide repeat protein [Desulfatiglans sp.]